MIKIDEIYQALFVPYIFEHCSFQVHDRKYGPSALVHVHEPFGRSDPESIKTYIKGQESVGNHVYFLDQEPLAVHRQQDTYQTVADKFGYPPIGNKLAFVTSEYNSLDVMQLQKFLKAEHFYYFFHGWAALDWFRGYDKTWLIKDPYKRTITKTFFSPNRIIGGERDHRVAMLYWFEKLKLMHNHISAPKVCPVENTDIVDIGHRMSKQYPDIAHIFKDADLPRTFKGEDTPLMTSYYLSNFEECAESMVYHVTETVATGQKQHLTEKIFKPIALQMPFVLTGTAGALKYLQGYGFQTFNSIWDESYDDIEDDYARYKKIAHLLFQLDSLNTKEKQDTFTRCLPIIQHNYQHFYGGTFEELLWKELKGMLKSLNDYFSN